MKNTLQITALIILGIMSGMQLSAQEVKKEKKVIRIRLIDENNGIKHEIDTTLTDPTDADIEAALAKYHVDAKTAARYKGNLHTGMGDKEIETIITNAKKEGGTVVVKEIKEGEPLPADVRMLLDSLGVHKEGEEAKMVIVDMNEDINDNGKGTRTEKKIILIKHVRLADLGKEELVADKKADIKNPLQVAHISLQPNPTNGLLKLSFNLTNTGNTTVSIINKEGKSVYEEQLKDFTGSYEKQVNLSSEQGGLYYLKVQQGDKVLYKKILIE